MASVLSILGGSFSFAEQVTLSEFGLLNNNEPAPIIDKKAASDLLNVDVTPGGKSVKKRQGYGSYKALGTGQPVRGGYHFYDSNGSDVQIWGSSTSLYGIVADATPTQLISSATLNSTWDCADTQGNAYCVNSNRDALIQTNGTTKTWYTTPLGTMVEVTPDRLVIAGVSGTANTLYVSGSNNFTSFTPGLNATDPFTEVIAGSGGKLSHIRWACQKLLWWKPQSFGYFDFDNQFSAQVKIVSDNIGTIDNTSAVDPGGRVWFRGQDGHTWMYDCSGLQKMSIPITPNVQVSGARVSNSWTQSSQAEFQTGGSSPTANISTTISAGDVVQSSFSASEYSSTQWNGGTSSNMSIGASSITLSINNSGNISDPSYESSTGGGPTYNFSSNWTVITNSAPSLWISRQTLSNGTGCTLTAQSGSYFAHASGTPEGNTVFQIILSNGLTGNSATVLASQPITQTNNCVWTLYTLTDAADLGKRVRFQIKDPNSGVNNYLVTTESYIFGGSISFYGNSSDNSGGHGPGGVGIDNITTGSSTITTGWFQSQVFDTKLSSPIYQATTLNYTVNTTTPTFGVFTSPAATGPWTLILSTSGTNAWGQRYALYSSTISVSSTESAATYISSITLVARSTGTYYSAVKNAPSLTAWSTFTAGKQDNGGTHNFFMRSSSNSFTVLSATPAWIAQTAGAQVSPSTAVYFQVIDSFTVTSATATPTLNDFTANWFEGAATDQAYMLYFDNAIWQSVAFGSGQLANNYIFKYDLINEGWTLYNFGTGGMLIQNNALYFGDTSSGNVFKFGTGTSDNGSSIRAFWKSKAFMGTDPWNQNALNQLDTYWTRNTNQTSSITYTMDGSTTTTAYTISLSSTTKSIISNMKLLPSGKIGQLFDIQAGDTSDSSRWELLGVRIGYTQLPYKPTQ